MDLSEVTKKLEVVIQSYSKKFSINCTDDWYIMKLQEELGELTSVYLKLTNRARQQNLTKEDLDKNFREEISDVIALTLLFAKQKNIDIEEAIAEKWFINHDDQK